TRGLEVETQTGGSNMSDQKKKKITRHTELEVYQKAFAAAMKIFEFSKSFPVEEKLTKFDVHRDRSAPIRPKLGASVFTARILPANSMTARRKQPKRRHGFSSLSNVVTWRAKPLQSFTKNTNPSSLCSSQ